MAPVDPNSGEAHEVSRADGFKRIESMACAGDHPSQMTRQLTEDAPEAAMAVLQHYQEVWDGARKAIGKDSNYITPEQV